MADRIYLGDGVETFITKFYF